MTDPVSLAQLALDYGFVPIGLKWKRPLLPQWQKTTKEKSLEKIEKLAKTGSINNIGILTGEPSGVVVVDIDKSRGGLDFWNELLQTNEVPFTFTVRTGSGGLHYYFAYDDRTAKLRNATTAVKKAGIDLKTTGGQVVFPGSTHESGAKYELIDGYEGDTIYIAEMPDWLLQLLEANQRELDLRYKRVR